MDERVLEEQGLKKSEIKAYLALLSLGKSTAGQILQKARMPNSMLHYALNSLIGKGIVSFSKKGQKRVYSPADPAVLISLAELRKKELEKTVKELKSVCRESEGEESAVIFEGRKGIMAALLEMISGTKKGDEFVFFAGFAGKMKGDREIQAFYKKFNEFRKEKSLISRGIAPSKIKAFLKPGKNYLLKFVDFPVPANKGVCNDFTIIISWGKNPKAVLIKSKEIAEKEKAFFDKVWAES